MDFDRYSFRHASEVLSGRRAWAELETVLQGIGRDEIIERQQRIAARGRRPKGGQSALNAVIRERLGAVGGWIPEPRLFGDDPTLREWRMDFLKEAIGVEVSFNHAEAVAWQFTRLTIAGESPRVGHQSQIEVGVTIVASPSLKAWSRMDSAVGTFDIARAWLAEMRPILPVPLMLIGLRSDSWEPTEEFPGTGH
jgi:hypothetical protein